MSSFPVARNNPFMSESTVVCGGEVPLPHVVMVQVCGTRGERAGGQVRRLCPHLLPTSAPPLDRLC